MGAWSSPTASSSPRRWRTGRSTFYRRGRSHRAALGSRDALTVAILGGPMSANRPCQSARRQAPRTRRRHARPHRDRREGKRAWAICALHHRPAGLERPSRARSARRMREQTEQALEEADVALFLIDAPPIDAARPAFAQWLRRAKLPIVLVANRRRGATARAAAEAFALGLGRRCLSRPSMARMDHLYSVCTLLSTGFGRRSARSALQLALSAVPMSANRPRQRPSAPIACDRPRARHHAGCDRAPWQWHGGPPVIDTRRHGAAPSSRSAREMSVATPETIRFAEVVVLGRMPGRSRAQDLPSRAVAEEGAPGVGDQ